VSGADDFAAYDRDGQPLPEPVLRQRVKRKPGMAPAPSEDGFHITLKKALTYGVASPGFTSRAGLFWCSHEVRNSGKPTITRSGKRINLEGVNRKMRGVVSGFPDVQFVYQGRSYLLELKKPGGKPSHDQIERHAALRAAGCPVAVVDNLRDAIAQMTAWGLPHNLRVA